MEVKPAYEETFSESQIFRQLPNELAELIRTAHGSQYLDALALGALEPRCTESVFALYEPVFVDLAARWLVSDPRINPVLVLSAFSRILPFAPYLRPLASQYATARDGPLSALAESRELRLLQLDNATVRTLLLTLFRLLSFDLEAFSRAISPIQLQSLFQHQDRCVRYLAVRCFCLYMHAADAATEQMIRANAGDEPIEEEWEGVTIEYRFLGLWEERRWQTLEKRLREIRLNRSDADYSSQIDALQDYFTPRTANVGGILVPKLRSDVSPGKSSLVKTPTAVGNLRKIAKSLLGSKPLLLIGLPNSGKTSLVNDVAETMGQASSMVTLHLNEQTDAKSLLGMYTTSSTTGSFTWQPGVLTKAAREGRWVLIEDLDRAPPEVIGLMLPVIEKGELIIPSRKERVKCAEGFRLIATIKSSLNLAGEETTPSLSMLGSRLWERIHVGSLAMDEIRDVLIHKFPLLSSRVSMLMDAYSRLCSAFYGSLAVRSSQGRAPGLRDLIKLCHRLHRRLQLLGAKTGYEAAPEGTQDEIFMDAVDVFLGYLPDKALQSSLASAIAEALHISPQRAQFCLSSRTPGYSDQGNSLLLGREVCQKMKVPKAAKSKPSSGSSHFAPTRPALKTMEQVAAAVQLAEPVLLVGETGIGKTAVIQQLATLMRQKLTVINLSQQSENTDLLGGFKPVNVRSLAVPMLDEFNLLFELTFSAKKNQKFLSSVAKSVAAGNWPRLVNLWHEAVRLANGVFGPSHDSADAGNQEQPAKKRKLDSSKYQGLRKRWEAFAAQLKDFEAQASQGDAKFAFAFVQGKVVRALRNGEWVLLDEINLASPDTLENIASLLHHESEGPPSVLLSEAGDVERIFGHPDFRIFGAMNPATDAGKRDLAPGLRSRFTEIYVHSPDSELDDLLGLVQTYLGDLTISDPRAASDLAHLYMETKKLSVENRLTDGAGQRPHFSIRTLVRSLIYIVDHAHIYGLRRAIFEGFSMSFLTLLSQDSERMVMPLLEKHIFGNAKNARSLLGQMPRPPNDGIEYVRFKHYWMRKGAFDCEEQPHYIITPFIEKNLKNLVRASSTRRFPVLLQGPTSAGKTSMIEYLAKISGNKFVRINNHEHTDLQEYLGSYVSADDGSLRYQEGILVEALRHGYWIVLDELNLAPSDVLEALNRLLDDNRELFIPETQEVVHPHPNFMLFATQNPAGLYGGRKVLSRAFRNRFLELHFDDIPENELEFILKERSQIAPSFCSRIVAVYRKLSVLRQTNRLFEQKNSFATLRDLFRWALRRADDREQLAINGFMLLAERVRNPQERAAVKAVIEEVMRVRIDEDAIYSYSQLEQRVPDLEKLSTSIIWTKAMRRLFILVSQAIENNEPVLLVGETGCGKTQLCQAIAEVHGKQLFTVNAHVNLETGDLIGAQRPLRNRSGIEKQLLDDLRTLLCGVTGLDQNINEQSLEELKKLFYAACAENIPTNNPELVKRIERNIARSNALFEWSDGSLVSAMKAGQYFLLDEVSLADDSVLERLNSVLEPHRSLLLAEKGPIDSLVVASEGFQFLATMNPGGDYGKRELSAALRNRLTEIWVPQLSEDDDILPILTAKLNSPLENAPKAMLDFAKWFKATVHNSTATSISIRDLLGWVDFVNRYQSSDPMFAMVHGASMVYIDTLGANPAAMLAVASDNLEKNRQTCLEKLGELFGCDASGIYHQAATISVENGNLNIGPFKLPMCAGSEPDPQFIMDAPTTVANSVRIARGLQSSKPILLEGSPGVGKTTLVAALARALGKPLTRINLSEQTDLTDLFGSDVPVEGGDIGQFTWRDAPFLRAMQRGDWVLLDEMNLASQSVLEGLNSCLDHRQQVYVAELDQTFKRHPDFVLFAAQNPHHQGGGRKGLPASFVNRFTVVYAESFSDADLKRICGKLFPGSPSEQTDKLVDFISFLNAAITRDRRLGAIGGPWEINLRDISRWFQLADRGNVQVHSKHFLDVIISQRFRTEEDRALVSQLYREIFGEAPDDKSYYHNLTLDNLQVGFGIMQRDQVLQRFLDPLMKILPSELPILESLILCIEQAWPSILVGPAGCGKTTVLRKLAAVSGAHLVELALSADTDTMDLVGGFEQIDYRRQISSLADDLALFLQRHIIRAHSTGEGSNVISDLLEVYQICKATDASLDSIMSSVSTLCKTYPDLGAEDFVTRSEALVKVSRHSGKVGFEWTEGVLTQAIQQGHWVVLDNANLCNPSVLDRLNSLMEPNGVLILNEQRTGDGSARVIRPHPNFRLFLTMDPRHGELSRAMRNRSLEICFLPQATENFVPQVGPAYTCDSRLYRLRSLWNVDMRGSLDELRRLSYEVRLDHLSAPDLMQLQSSLNTLVSTSSDVSVKEEISSIIHRYVSTIQEGSSWKAIDNLALQKSKILSGDADKDHKPLHPLINEPWLSISGANLDRSQVIILAYLQEFKLELYRLQQSLARVDESAKFLKPSQMTRLQRSLASRRIQALMKDTTQPVASFLIDCGQALYAFIQNLGSDALKVSNTVSIMRAIINFCWDIFTTTQARELDEGEFQTYLQIGQEISASLRNSQSLLSPLASILSQSLDQFRAGWALSTGQSMQRIWDSWRPATPVNQDHLQSLIELEEVVSEFTNIALQTHVQLPQLCQVRDSLIDAQRAIVLNGADGKLLITNLKQMVGELAAVVQHSESTQSSYFSAQFEALCQYHDLSSLWSGDRIGNSSMLQTSLPLLAGRPARPADTSNIGSQIPDILHRLSSVCGFGDPSNNALGFRGVISLSLLEKLMLAGNTTLGQMTSLGVERNVLAEAVSSSTQILSVDQSKLFVRMLSRLVLELMACHQEFFEPGYLKHVTLALRAVEEHGSYQGQPVSHVKLSEDLPQGHYFRGGVESALSKCLSFLTMDAESSERHTRETGLVSVQLAITLLRLYVPDKPFDPSLGLVVQRKRHSQRVLELTTKSEAISAYELEFSGRSSNLRYRLLQKELQELGSEPPASSVTRPQQSQIGQLQGEFVNLMNSVLNRNPEDLISLEDDSAVDSRQEGKLLRDNIRQICHRLSANYRSYDDITILIVRFLQLLDLGISLASSEKPRRVDVETVRAISEKTPFLGGKPDALPNLGSRTQTLRSKHAVEVRFHDLSVITTAQNTDLSSLLDAVYRDNLLQVFEEFHQLWKSKLQEDQEKEAQKTAFYRYKGSFEDEEEADENELRELFPTYEDLSTEEDVESTRIDPKSMSLRLSTLHAKLFKAGDTQESLRNLVKDSALLLGSVWSSAEMSKSPAHPNAHLPGVFLLLEDAMNEAEQKSPKNYNFYTDPNLAEAKKLVSLVRSVQSRFIQIQVSWPEHAVLQEVISCCKEILQFKHTEPVAKFLTKVEKLHAYVYEWQLVASREYSAAPQYDELTGLIISWRRLELSTWAKLLDIEKEKCDQDVSSWWFVAYEAIIAAPLQMAQSGQDLTEHTREAISTLEKFFISATIGEYSPRMRLVENFRSLLLLYVRDFPALGGLASALQNFLQHYRPFEAIFSKTLADGRHNLEKDITQQIQLASWKDTNIIALRESARRSHYKLFKIVRKYRALLAQPAEPVLGQGMPDAQEELDHVFKEEPIPSSEISPQAFAICKANAKLWESRAPRFKDPEATASNMMRVYASTAIEFNVAEQLAAFVKDVVENIQYFKSQTPKTLTEENMAEVQHLKAQKRRFYAEKLHQLYLMGIKRNPGTDLIEKQSSTAQVLATVPSLSAATTTSERVRSAESYFHRFLDLIPSIRQASREYSEDLSNVEVSRSVGSVEGLLYLTRRQRIILSPALSEVESLKSAVLRMGNIWSCGPNSLSEARPAMADESKDLKRTVAWLVPILGLGTTIIEIHSKFSKTDSSRLLEEVRAWRGCFKRLKGSLEGLPELPTGVSSRLHDSILKEARSSLDQLNRNITTWNQERPDLSFALGQMIPWTEFKAASRAEETRMDHVSLDDFDGNLLKAVDQMLVGLQLVSSSLQKLPTSAEDRDWLSKSDEVFSEAIKKLHISDITKSLDSVMDKLQYLQGRGINLPIASALIASVLPIVKQYHGICRDIIDRLLSVHREICKMSYILAKSFKQVASEGFCSPAEASGEESKAGKLESGTGLGEGEGAEDISKDVQDDEDLSELAQQEQTEGPKEDMENSENAVNMDQEDLQGESGDNGDEKDEEEGSGSDEEGEDDLDEEVGSVDDLDPSAVDEKLWDGARNEEQKETENEAGKGTAEPDQQAAAQDQGDQEQKEGDEKQQGEEEEEEEDEEAPEDEGEAIGREEMDVTDPHAKEEQALDLPEDMQLDGDEKEGAESDMDEGMDDLSDMGPDIDEEQPADQDDKMEDEGTDLPEDQGADQTGEDGEDMPDGEDRNEAEAAEEEETGEQEQEDEQQDILRTQREDHDAAKEDVAPSEAVTGGLGTDQDQSDEKGTSGDAQQDSGSKDESDDTNEQNGAAEEGQEHRRTQDPSGGGQQDDVKQDDLQQQAFKKLGDVLEQWHRKQREIMNASKEEEDHQALPQDTDMADADFEHLADQEDVADTQALGQATEEQAKALDHNKAVESDKKPENDETLPDASDDHQDNPADKMEDDIQADQAMASTDPQATGTFMNGDTRAYERSDDTAGQKEATTDLDEVDSHLSAIHLSSTLPPRTSAEEARQLWSQYESATNDLSLSLTEQLRLILAPTLATKLRGDFRTGKRLNIKRIIPYIASQYKRDKIWMRRSIPSKRNYQIMLAVDDSKSMLESGSGQLAFETLALVAKSLSMLEVGDLCILGFGNEDHVRVAHEFGKPFSSEAGMQVFQQFSYQQTGTNVRKLVADSIALFREARSKRSPTGGNADLWQLELVISDGICEDHDTIRRLVRQAMEERIMIVFIIVDAIKGSSILDLTQATFEADDASGTGEMKLKMKRYLEGFPFPYYLVVRDVRELPAVLATALKQWFAEVVDVSS
ncbi:hypothetical protein VTN02DRAFT_4005 [Thermoascus thermophilus]